MSESYPEDLSLGYGLVALCQMAGARSSWLQKGTSLIDSNLPFAESRIEQMAEIVDEMATAYAKVGREMESIFFGFENTFLLAVCERSLRVVLLFPSEKEDLTEAVTSARRFIRKNRPKILSTFEATQAIFLKAQNLKDFPSPTPVPTPVPTPANPWPKIEPKIRNILTHVVNSTQAQSLIDRTLAERALPNGPQKQDIAKVARDIVLKIPHRTKRAASLTELEELLEDYRVS